MLWLRHEGAARWGLADTLRPAPAGVLPRLAGGLVHGCQGGSEGHARLAGSDKPPARAAASLGHRPSQPRSCPCPAR
ncbi:hypothetical protein PCLA_04r0147 [Pseudomonas citronellolis]|nr:hypothetical protein PCLA_04r0147 [Pseudomonas citronellolis]